MAQSDKPALPDLGAGVLASSLGDGEMLAGRVGTDDVLIARIGDEFLAVKNRCTHYGGTLSDGIIVGDTVRCPLHHACFSLRSGRALRAPAFDPVDCWRVDREGETIVVRERAATVAAESRSTGRAIPKSVVIVGGGAAGLAAADTLRAEGYEGSLTMVSGDESAPYDRPNLSKDYLAGDMPDDWLPLKTPEFYKKHNIELVLGDRVLSIDVGNRRVVLERGEPRLYDALLLATGADPIHPPIPGADGPRVRYLRSLKDSAAIVASEKTAGRVVVIGASFIGLEVAAACRLHGLEVSVVAPEKVPLARVMGEAIGARVRKIHEAHGVAFHLGQNVTRIDDRIVTLADGTTLDGDFIVMGVGVRPSTQLAVDAGLSVDRGVIVDEFLETSVPGIFAAGDIARWPEKRSGDRFRVEHWVVAERQGQQAARNMLGHAEPFLDVPFFWSQHYDVTIRYVGHAESWDGTLVEGSIDALDCKVTFLHGKRVLAVATIGRDLDSLRAELAIENTKE